jgi:predicted TIM-barrel fold metal-dependent hydrolase
MEIIDAHVHLYRTLELEKRNVVQPGRRDRDRWGNPESAVRFMAEQGVSNMVCLPNFPTRQMRERRIAALQREAGGGAPPDLAASVEEELKDAVRRHNEWICALAREDPRFVPAISLQKLFAPDEMAEEVRLRASEGAKAVKLLPGLYFESPDDQSFWPMYEECQALGLTIISDTGTLGFSEAGLYYGEPFRFEPVLETFPRLHLVMAHFASAFWDERVELAKRYANLFFDTSGSFFAEGLEVRDGARAAHLDDAVRLVRAVGPDRIMFGSDGPRFAFQPQLEQILGLDLSESEKTLVFAENARRVYRID